MKVVKCICPHCKKGIEYTTFERIINILKRSVGSVLVPLGIIFIIYIGLFGIQNVAEDFIGYSFTMSAIKQSDDIRFLAVNITENCDGDNYNCLAKELFLNMSGIRYVPDSLITSKTYSPLYVYENGDDCEGLSQMYVSFAESVGVPAEVSCNYNHCVAIVTGGYNRRTVIDLTTPIAYRLFEDERFYEVDSQERKVW